MLFRFFLIILMLTLFNSNSAQTANSDSIAVLSPITNLFDAMREGDSAKLHKSFHEGVRMFTSYVSKEDKVILEEGSLNEFLVAVGTPHENVWNEKIWNVSSRIDDNIAQVWCDYGFYVDTNFSHCGVDAFQLVKNNEEVWQIISLMDTRKKENCYLPDGK